jgi:putative oxidoreductase
MGILPVRKRVALCCPDFPLSHYRTAIEPVCFSCKGNGLFGLALAICRNYIFIVYLNLSLCQVFCLNFVIDLKIIFLNKKANRNTKTMRIFKFIVCLLAGLMFINAGLNKLFHYIPTPELSEELKKVNEAFGTIEWLMPLIAIVEILGGVLLIIPKTRALGAIVLFPIMVGIILQHIYYAPEGLPMAGAFLLIILWVIIDNRNKYLTLIEK